MNLTPDIPNDHEWVMFWKNIMHILINAPKEHRFNCSNLNAWWPDRFNPREALVYAYPYAEKHHCIPISFAAEIFKRDWRSILTICYITEYPEHVFCNLGLSIIKRIEFEDDE